MTKSLMVKPGYASVCCSQCGTRQRVEIGDDPEGWVKVSTIRGKGAKVLCPECASNKDLNFVR
jgi:hypothetical protein